MQTDNIGKKNYKFRFWYVIDIGLDSKEIELGIKECKQPYSTAFWKQLCNMLDNDKVTNIGYSKIN